MESISVLTGVRFQPEHFLAHMKKSKKLSYIDFSYVDTLYSPCWVFQLRVALPVTKKVKRYAGYYAGFEESTMTPGKLTRLPGSHTVEVDESRILPTKLTEEQALAQAWDYNKLWVIRKFKSLNAPPELEDHKAECVYKPMYLMRFYNRELGETKYKVMDSLSGDLEDIELQ